MEGCLGNEEFFMSTDWNCLAKNWELLGEDRFNASRDEKLYSESGAREAVFFVFDR